MIYKGATQNHTFEIQLIELNQKYSFEIIAKDIVNKTSSSITNLNFIISEIIEPIFEIEDYETSLIVGEEIGKKLYLNAFDSFNNIEWVKFLELKLQEDKEAGEWS